MIICVDFDGVLHSYTSGWQGADRAEDPPVDGAIAWLEEMVWGWTTDELEGVPSPFKVAIYSSRSKQMNGVETMSAWLIKHGLRSETLSEIDFPTQKPPAFLTIDDRAICFDGLFPHPADLLNFKPWNKK